MSKPRVFFSTATRAFELVSAMCVDQHPSRELAEDFLIESKAEYVKNREPDPDYWDTVRIFKVTVEEVPRTANVKPTARKRRAGGKS